MEVTVWVLREACNLGYHDVKRNLGIEIKKRQTGEISVVHFLREISSRRRFLC